MKSFRLPTGNTTGEFQSLYTQYPTYDQMRKYPVGMVLGGYYYWNNGTLYNQSIIGVYWSSLTYITVDRTYNLTLNGNNSIVTPVDDADKRDGFTLRCLAKNQTKNKKTLKLNKNRQTDKTKRK